MEGLHGLPAVAAPTFFPKASKNKDIWWETKTPSSTSTLRDESENEPGEAEDTWDPSDEQENGHTKTTAYLWDSMDEEDRKDTIDTLQQSDEWVIWKSKDKWSTTLKAADFHQLLYIKKDTQEDCWGSKIKGWWRSGDIRVKKPKKTYKCWVKNKTKVPMGAQDVIITALQAPNLNSGKDEYVVDTTGHETHYWQGTESGLLGAFEFQGACTAGDGSCDMGSKSMGAGFCNLGQLGWNTQTPLPPPSLQDQRTRNSRKVGREDEGVSSTRPEMVALAECLEDHDDKISLLYLTDSEAILQAIHRWIGCGAKLNLSKSPDADVLKRVIIKLQKRVLAGAATLLVKVKAHRGDPLNEEADIRAELGRLKGHQEVKWNDPTNRTIYRWQEGHHTRSTTWTNTVRNRFRQKAGEIEAFQALEIGAAKWCKEHIPRKGKDLHNITEEGMSLLDDTELWWEKQNLLWACHASRSKNRVNRDGSFVQHQIGAISSTFTSDWYLRKGESRDKMGEWLKKATVRSQDQRRMLQANTHSFPSNYWRNKITKGKESDKCDLCRALWIAEGRFNTEDELPTQTLGHIQHQCEALSEAHTLAHHRCWRIIHAELRRLASSKWQFICINGEKNLKTIWNELEDEIPEVFNFCSVQTLENAATEQARHHPLTEAEENKHKAGTTKEKIVLDRLWNKRPDGFAIKMPTDSKAGELVILEFKRMSCVTDQYVKRARNAAEAQYAVIKSALQQTLGPQGWTVSQRSFIAGARSLNEKDLHDNLAYFKVPQAGIDSIRSKLAFKIFDEYANILKGMYSTKFNGRPTNQGDHDQMITAPGGPSPPLITFLQAWQPNNIRRQKEKEKKGID